MDYLPYLRRSIVNPLVRGDVEEAAQVMQVCISNAGFSLLQFFLSQVPDECLRSRVRSIWKIRSRT